MESHDLGRGHGERGQDASLDVAEFDLKHAGRKRLHGDSNPSAPRARVRLITPKRDDGKGTDFLPSGLAPRPERQVRRGAIPSPSRTVHLHGSFAAARKLPRLDLPRHFGNAKPEHILCGAGAFILPIPGGGQAGRETERSFGVRAACCRFPSRKLACESPNHRLTHHASYQSTFLPARIPPDSRLLVPDRFPASKPAG